MDEQISHVVNIILVWSTYSDLELEFAVDELFTALDGVTEPLVLGKLFGVAVGHQ